jgi:phosphoribosyl 1,2-cyclic phosphodiesterase
MKTILFGNRGSMPLGASENSPFGKYGGDTTCVGISFDDNTIISLDAGSGFWKWPYTLDELMNKTAPYDMHIFFSHYHMDHTMGLAQSPLLFNQQNSVNIYGPDFKPGLEQMFHDNANRPNNPDLMNFYKAKLKFNTLDKNDQSKKITLNNGATVSFLYMPHSKEESVGYRVDHNGQGVAFLTDTNHSFDENDKPVLSDKIIDFIKDADILIYDSHFSDKELNDHPFYRDFGHSTGEHGVRLCEKANIPMLITSHHNPQNNDKKMDELTTKFRQYGAGHNVYVYPALPSICIDLDLHPSARKQDLEQQKSAQQRWNKIAGNANQP